MFLHVHVSIANSLHALFFSLPSETTRAAAPLLRTPRTASRFNDFYSRYTSLVNSNKTNTLVEPSTTSNSIGASTTSTTTTSSSSVLPQQSSYVPLPRRRHTDIDTTGGDSERTFSTGTTTTTSSTWSNSTTSSSTTSPTSTYTAGQRRYAMFSVFICTQSTLHWVICLLCTWVVSWMVVILNNRSIFIKNMFYNSRLTLNDGKLAYCLSF